MADAYQITFGGRPVLAVRQAMKTARDHYFPDDHFRGKANSYVCPMGVKPGVGHVLLRKRDLDAVRMQRSVDLAVNYQSDDTGTRTAFLKGMIITSAEQAFPGRGDDGDACFLVTFADNRHAKRRVNLAKAYNLRDRCDGDWINATLNGDAAWTWQAMVSDIWSSIGGGSLVLPYTPDGTPEGFNFYDCDCAMDALGDVLLRIDCHLVYDPRTGTYSVKRAAGGKAALDNLDRQQQFFAWNDRQEQYPQADWPEKVRVRFRKRPLPADEANPYTTKDVTASPAPASNLIFPGTVLILNDDLHDTGENDAALTARAQERMAEWVRRRSSIEFPTTRSWKGFVPAAFDLLGETVSAVCVADRGGDAGGAFATEVFNAEDFAIAKWKWKDNPEWLCCIDDGYPYGSYDDGNGGASFKIRAYINWECAGGQFIADDVEYTVVLLLVGGRLTATVSVRFVEENKVMVPTECKEFLSDVDVVVTVECVDSVITTDTDITKTTAKVRGVVCGSC